MRNLENSFSQKCVRFLDGLKSLILRIAHWFGKTAGVWITLLIVVAAYLLSGIVSKQVRGAVYMSSRRRIIGFRQNLAL